MRKLIVSEFVSLDGVMQAPGGKDEDRDGGFEHGGWTMPYCSSQLVRTLLAHDLVDELHLLLYPLTLGRGKRLWADDTHTGFALRSATPYPTGVVGWITCGSDDPCEGP